jgi:hypothetical protein
LKKEVAVQKDLSSVGSKFQSLLDECSELARQATWLVDYLAKESAERQSGQCDESNKALSYSFRKKPLVVEAFQMTRERMNDNYGWPEWLDKAWQLPRDACGTFSRIPGADILYVNTSEGKRIVSPNDYIIRSVNGELYPCRPDVFEADYEPLD